MGGKIDESNSSTDGKDTANGARNPTRDTASAGDIDKKTRTNRTTGRTRTSHSRADGKTTTTDKKTDRPHLVDLPPPIDIIPQKNIEESGKKKRGRPKKQQTPSQTAAPALASFICITSDIAGERFGPHWKISKIEADTIADPLSRLFGKIPGIQNNSDEIMLIIALTVVLAPRVYTSYQLSRQGEGKNNERENTNNTGLTSGANTNPIHDIKSIQTPI